MLSAGTSVINRSTMPFVRLLTCRPCRVFCRPPTRTPCYELPDAPGAACGNQKVVQPDEILERHRHTRTDVNTPNRSSSSGLEGAMPHDLVLRNGLVVTPSGVFEGGVAVDGETIVAAGASSTLGPARREIDVHGKVIFPGTFDPHTHFGSG